MKIARLAFALLFVWCPSLLLAQTPAVAKQPVASTEPPIVDVHASAYRKGIVFRTNSSPRRFEMRHATIFDMIEFAYDLGEQDDDRENPAIVGGPAWIDFDRFDVIARMPSLKAASLNADGADASGRLASPAEQFRPILQRVLADRFHLTYHREDRPLPGFIVTVAKDGPRLAEAKATDTPGSCQGTQDKANPAQSTVACTSETMGQFISTLDQDFSHTIVDRTGLTKAYDFTLRLVLGPDVHTRDDRARVYTEALGKQLGLVVTRGDVPQPGFVVDKVDRVPTPNAPEVAALLPALPDLEFEVASIRLAGDKDPRDTIRASGSQITFSGFNLQGLLTRAWQLPTGAMLGDALPLLPSTRFTILVKLPPEIDGLAVYEDPDQIANMLQKLLVDRFQIKYHWGEWTQPDAYVLMAGTPKMKKADPNSHSFCKYGPAEGEKAARYMNSAYDAEFHCQNVTMGQFADLVETVAASDVKNRVPDKTGLAGSYDFTVYYTAGRTLRTRTSAATQEAKLNGNAAPAPVEGISVEEAFRKQLGLKLERQPMTVPALVLDHFEPVPTAN
jgi:uncharacterized protein (TIGR03435 family)